VRVVITGANGRAGGYAISEFLEHGYEVTATIHRNLSQELAMRATPPPGRPAEEAPIRFLRADMGDYGQTVSALRGADAVVHLAAIPHPRTDPPHVVFETNVMSMWNVLQAAEVLGIKKLVLASSVNAIGAIFSSKRVPPLHFPIDEEHPTRAEDPYALSKWIGEQIADGFARKRSVQIASFRLHWMAAPEALEKLRENPLSDPEPRSKDFWGYVDQRDCAGAYRLAIEAEWEGHEAFFINAGDTSLSIPTKQALEQCYPDVPLKRELGEYEMVIDCSKAKRFFGWEPKYGWRSES
jgi:nucleoside-diphosphate-sugar epimerase